MKTFFKVTAGVVLGLTVAAVVETVVQLKESKKHTQELDELLFGSDLDMETEESVSLEERLDNLESLVYGDFVERTHRGEEKALDDLFQPILDSLQSPKLDLANEDIDWSVMLESDTTL